MIDVHIPTTDGRELQLTRTTQPEPELTLLLNRLRFELQPAAPKNHRRRGRRRQPPVVPTYGVWRQRSQRVNLAKPDQSAKFG